MLVLLLRIYSNFIFASLVEFICRNSYSTSTLLMFPFLAVCGPPIKASTKRIVSFTGISLRLGEFMSSRASSLVSLVLSNDLSYRRLSVFYLKFIIISGFISLRSGSVNSRFKFLLESLFIILPLDEKSDF